MGKVDFNFNFPDSLVVIFFALIGSLFLGLPFAIAGARRARSFWAGLQATFAGVACGALLFYVEYALVNIVLPRHGTSEFILVVLVGLMALSTSALAYRVAREMTGKQGSPGSTPGDPENREKAPEQGVRDTDR